MNTLEPRSITFLIGDGIIYGSSALRINSVTEAKTDLTLKEIISIAAEKSMYLVRRFGNIYVFKGEKLPIVNNLCSVFYAREESDGFVLYMNEFFIWGKRNVYKKYIDFNYMINISRLNLVLKYMVLALIFSYFSPWGMLSFSLVFYSGITLYILITIFLSKRTLEIKTKMNIKDILKVMYSKGINMQSEVNGYYLFTSKFLFMPNISYYVKEDQDFCTILCDPVAYRYIKRRIKPFEPPVYAN